MDIHQHTFFFQNSKKLIHKSTLDNPLYTHSYNDNNFLDNHLYIHPLNINYKEYNNSHPTLTNFLNTPSNKPSPDPLISKSNHDSNHTLLHINPPAITYSKDTPLNTNSQI
jgi:hypothetical protein